MRDWESLDKKYIWHPFTQMQDWLSSNNIVVKSGTGAWLIDTHGNRYLDGVSSLWVNVHGHNNCRLNDSIKSQLEKISHSTLLGLAGVPSIELAEKLVEITPEGLDKVFYSDSGSTAVEVALKVAFQYWKNLGRTEKKIFVGLDQAYHGDTIGSVSLGGIDLFHSIFNPLLFKKCAIPTPFPYEFPDLTPEEVKERCLDNFRKLVSERSHEIAALIVEPLVQGAAGMIVHPPGFLKALEQICRNHEILLICDEVATGFGKTGTMFACEREKVVPDIICLAKGLTGGYLPLAATLFTDQIFEAFLGPYSEYRTFFHGHSYTGNALACAAANGCIKIFEEDKVIEQIQPKIGLLSELLDERISPLVHVSDVRQCGFMVGIQLAQDRDKRTPYPLEKRTGALVTQNIRKHGVILRPLGDVVVIMPPLCITEDELEFLVSKTALSIMEICGAN
ncbi:MAG: adenosylmethionine--8-amino-7-oxononanoate transaminase [Syntrophaceae bacterium]|nr:adenosylmethionine--8-amino-7-oxononanoate transaminase [Syntrophaceae bacterium]